MEPLAYYRWLFAAGMHTESLGLTWCTGIGIDEVIARLGGGAASAEEMTVRQAYGLFDPPRPVLVGQAGEAVLIAEPWGVFGAIPEMLKRLSQSGAQAVSVFWNVEWDNALTVGRDGEVVLRFDMVTARERLGTAPDQFEAVLEGFPWGSEPDDWKAAGLRVAEEVSGSRLPADWLDVPMVAVAPVEPPRDLVPDAHRHHPVLAEPELARILSDPRPENLAAIARLAAETAVRDTGLAGDTVDEVLVWLRTRDDEEARKRLRYEMEALAYHTRRRAEPLMRAEGGTSEPGSPSHALVRQASAADALTEALKPNVAEAALWGARYTGYIPRLTQEASLRAAILANCADHIRAQLAASPPPG